MAEQINPIDSSYTIANKKILAEGDDLNNISDGKYCYINAHNPNNSTGTNATVYQFTTYGRNEDKYQIAFDRNNMCIKARLYTGTDWTEWKVMFSFS